MTARDYETAPVSESLGLKEIILGLAADLVALRAGKITIADAQARAALAKQMFNGVRLYLAASKYLDGAQPTQDAPAIEGKADA